MCQSPLFSHCIGIAKAPVRRQPWRLATSRGPSRAYSQPDLCLLRTFHPRTKHSGDPLLVEEEIGTARPQPNGTGPFVDLQTGESIHAAANDAATYRPPYSCVLGRMAGAKYNERISSSSKDGKRVLKRGCFCPLNVLGWYCLAWALARRS